MRFAETIRDAEGVGSSPRPGYSRGAAAARPRDGAVRELTVDAGRLRSRFSLSAATSGARVFVYGIRVLGRRDVPPAKALNPFGVETGDPQPSKPAPPT
jgi:hypothetical protein